MIPDDVAQAVDAADAAGGPGMQIALLDVHGVIISVNEEWRRFAVANSLPNPGHGLGLNYLSVCDAARQCAGSDAGRVADGIRAVLDGRISTFSIEYDCHSPAQEHWYLLTVCTMEHDDWSGAVVTHLNITAERRTKDDLRNSEILFRQVVDNIGDVIFLRDVAEHRILYVSPAYERIFGRTPTSGYQNEQLLLESIHPDDLARFETNREQRLMTGRFELEHRIVRPDRSVRWIEARGFPIHDQAGKLVRVASIAKDVTKIKEVEQSYRESERRFGDLLRHVDLASVMLDCDGDVSFCNDYFLRLTGWQYDEIIGRNYFAIFQPSETTLAKGYFAHLLSTAPEKWHRENVIRTRTGEERTMRWSNIVLRSATGRLQGSASIGEDITERRLAESQIAYLNRVHAMLSGINTLIVRVRDRDELFREACRIAVDVGGLSIALIGMFDPRDRKLAAVGLAGKNEAAVAAIQQILASTGGRANAMVEQAVRDRQPVVANDSQNDPRVAFREKHVEFGCRSMVILPLVVMDEVAGVIALYATESQFFHEQELKLLTELAGDIAFAVDHIGKRERLDYLAYYDSLCGLANRSLFLDRVTQHVKLAADSEQGLALFIVDIERFKNINYSLGRPVGDAMLKQVAEWLTLTVGDENLLSRVGGDQFSVLLPNTGAEEAAQRVEEWLQNFSEHAFTLNDTVYRIAARAGIALYPDDGETADILLKNAEAALKKAKVAGDRYLFYAHKMTATVAGRLTLENQLRQALSRGEFVLHYQPKVDRTHTALTGVEALIRWNDPRTGMVPPGRFIGILEETGLIQEVGRWALRTAVADHLRWRAAGVAPVRVAVNVSPLQLRNPAFINHIEEVIAVDDHAASGLEIEITENVIMEDVKSSIATLHSIRGMGLKIAIDDFGTGFSSLSYLAKLPVDMIKIDRSFITDMTSGPEGLALVSMIVSLARSLKLKVVAEGVETEEQANLLRLLNCDEMQGYLFCKPLPVEVFEAAYLKMNPQFGT
jgi:diguanylate cyclase (GGDEF)-like protein/PAS domain S-box-containing protein